MSVVALILYILGAILSWHTIPDREEHLTKLILVVLWPLAEIVRIFTGDD